jgi:hypothetical protein
MRDFFYICGMVQINDLVGVKPSIHSAIEEYTKIIVPKPIESLTVSYMGSGGWRIDVGVNESVYNHLNKKIIKTIKESFERHIQKEMTMMFPFTFEVFIVLSL